jgi:hypothetical protein
MVYILVYIKSRKLVVSHGLEKKEILFVDLSNSIFNVTIAKTLLNIKTDRDML